MHINFIEEENNLAERTIRMIENQSKKDEKKKAIEGLKTVLEFTGTLPEDFDYKKELEDAIEERYCN